MDIKRILITAGPTWVLIDDVRVISNIATGESGILLARELNRRGAQVTLLLGPADAGVLPKNIRLLRFKFFDELRQILKKELSARRYDIIVHSAAVSDFKPAGIIKGKIDSGSALSLRLAPLPKVIKDIRALAPEAKLVMFKLESGISDAGLIKEAKKALWKYSADLVVANRLKPNYKAFVLDSDKIYFSAQSKNFLVDRLIKNCLLSG